MSLNNNTHFQRALWMPGKSQGFTFIPHKSHTVGVRKPILQMGQLRLRKDEPLAHTAGQRKNQRLLQICGPQGLVLGAVPHLLRFHH